MVAGCIPWLGDALDVKDVVAPSSKPSDRVIGGASVTINAFTAGLAPNAGPIIRGARESGEAIDDLVAAFRSADEALDDALSVSQKELMESQADALSDMAKEGLIPNAMERGQINEANMFEKLAETKNTEVFSSSHGNTIPDINNSTEMGDIKDVAILADTKQMKAQREVAQAQGKTPVAHTGTNTHVTKPMEESGTKIIRHDEIGPQE